MIYTTTEMEFLFVKNALLLAAGRLQDTAQQERHPFFPIEGRDHIKLAETLENKAQQLLDMIDRVKMREETS